MSSASSGAESMNATRNQQCFQLDGGGINSFELEDNVWKHLVGGMKQTLLLHPMDPFLYLSDYMRTAVSLTPSLSYHVYAHYDYS